MTDAAPRPANKLRPLTFATRRELFGMGEGTFVTTFAVVMSAQLDQMAQEQFRFLTRAQMKALKDSDSAR